jgi:uncharacterized protein
MSDLSQLVRDPTTSFAVVGASSDPDKYGNRIYRNLKGKGYRVFAINPRADDVDGDQAWSQLSDLPETPTVAVLVVPAPRGIGVLEQAAEAGIRNVWVQPGAFSDELGVALDEGGFDWKAEACVMIATNQRDGAH